MNISNRHYCNLFILLGFLNLYEPIIAKQYGSNRSTSRQATVFFPTADTNNALQGFTSFEGGLLLGSSAADVVLNVLFPLQGSVVLNGGTATLNNDITVKTPINIGPGKFISSSGNTLEFPYTTSGIHLPAQGYERVLETTDTITVKTRGFDVGGAINSVDWSFDNQYVAVAVSIATGVDELQIYSFQDEILTLEAAYSLNITDSGNAVRWHPSDYHLAFGGAGTNTLEILSFDPLVPSLTVVSQDVLAGAITAVAWHTSGDYLAVGLENVVNAVVIYVVDNAGNLGASQSYSFSGSCAVQNNALIFDTTGNYLALGLATGASIDELQVLQVASGVPTWGASQSIGQTVSAVDWQMNTLQLSVGLSGGTERLRLYKFNNLAHTLVEQLSARVAQQNAVYGVQWDLTGAFLAAVTATNAQGYELDIYFNQGATNVFDLVGGAEIGADCLCLSWSSDGDFIAIGDANGELTVYNFASSPLYFESVRLVFNSDVYLRSPVYFQGNCVVSANNNHIIFETNGAIIVDDNATLLIDAAVIDGIGNDNISCANGNSVLALRNVQWIQTNDFVFPMGAMTLTDECIFAGSGTIFAYQSEQTSMVNANSVWTLDTGFTFSYDPIFVDRQDAWQFANSSSQLVMNGSTLHVTTTGMQLLNGTIQVERDSFMYTEEVVYEDYTTTNAGITFGNNAGADMAVNIYSGADFILSYGVINYKNTTSTSWTCMADTASIDLLFGGILNFYQTMDISSGFLTLYGNNVLAFAPGANFYGSLRPFGSYTVTTL